MPIKRIAPNVSGDQRRVGVVLSRFNAVIGDGLLAGALRGLKEAGVADDDISVVTVPGALESPYAVNYGIMVLPNLFLIGKDGKVVSRGVQISGLEDEIKKLMN